jgi:hypothetical protein
VYRQLRIVGTVVIALIAIAIPALASASGDADAPKTAAPAIICSAGVHGVTGGAQSATPLAVASKQPKSRRRRHHHKRSARRHGRALKAGKATLCAPGCEAAACAPIPCPVADPGTPAVPSGSTPSCTPLPCPLGVDGTSDAPSGATVACPPVPCPTTAPDGNTAAPIGCIPVGCPGPWIAASGAGAGSPGAASGATVQCGPGACPLVSSSGTLGTSSTESAGTEVPARCPPIPSCPPLPSPAASTAGPAIACVTVTTGSAGAG